jgi:hypothetical protein
LLVIVALVTSASAMPLYTLSRRGPKSGPHQDLEPGRLANIPDDDGLPAGSAH